MLAFATAGSGFCFSQGRYFRLPVRASFFLTQLFASAHFCSAKPRLPLASERGRRNSLSLCEPSGFLIENLGGSVVAGKMFCNLLP